MIGQYASAEVKWSATLVGKIYLSPVSSGSEMSEMENYCLELLENRERIEEALKDAEQVASGIKPRIFPQNVPEPDTPQPDWEGFVHYSAPASSIPLKLGLVTSAFTSSWTANSAKVGSNTARVPDMNKLIVSRSRAGYSCEAAIKSTNYSHAFAYLNSEERIKTFLQMYKDIFGASTICETTETDVTLSDIYPGFSLVVQTSTDQSNAPVTEHVVEAATGVEYTLSMPKHLPFSGMFDQKRLVETLARVLFVLHTMSMVKPNTAASILVSGKGATYVFKAPQLVVSSTEKKCVDTYFNVPHAEPGFLSNNNLVVPCALMGSVKSGTGAFGEQTKESTALCTNDRVALTCTVRSAAGKIAFVHRYRDAEFQAGCPSSPQVECDAVLQNMMIIDPHPFEVSL